MIYLDTLRINEYNINILFAKANTKSRTMDFISARGASEKWDVSLRWVQKLCDEDRIEVLRHFGRYYMIPKKT